MINLKHVDYTSAEYDLLREIIAYQKKNIPINPEQLVKYVTVSASNIIGGAEQVEKEVTVGV